MPPPPAGCRRPPGAASIPATTPASDALSKDLQARGFRFVGSTIIYAFMQSVGLVDDHLPGCFRYADAGRDRLAVTAAAASFGHEPHTNAMDA